VEGSPSAGENFGGALRYVCEGIGEFFHRRHRLWHLMQAEERRQLWRRGRGREAWAVHRQRLIQSLVQVLQRGVDSEVIREDVPLEPLAVMLLGMIRNSVHTHDSEPSLSPAQVAELFLHGTFRAQAKATEDTSR